MSHLSLACNKKTAQSVRKHLAEVRIRRCKENLQALQQELRDFQQEVVNIDMELQETEGNIGRLRNLVLHLRQVRGVSDRIALHLPRRFYDSVESIPSVFVPEDQD